MHSTKPFCASAIALRCHVTRIHVTRMCVSRRDPFEPCGWYRPFTLALDWGSGPVWPGLAHACRYVIRAGHARDAYSCHADVMRVMSFVSIRHIRVIHVSPARLPLQEPPKPRPFGLLGHKWSRGRSREGAYVCAQMYIRVCADERAGSRAHDHALACEPARGPFGPGGRTGRV